MPEIMCSRNHYSFYLYKKDAIWRFYIKMESNERCEPTYNGDTWIIYCEFRTNNDWKLLETDRKYWATVISRWHRSRGQSDLGQPQSYGYQSSNSGHYWNSIHSKTHNSHFPNRLHILLLIIPSLYCSQKNNTINNKENYKMIKFILICYFRGLLRTCFHILLQS